MFIGRSWLLTADSSRLSFPIGGRSSSELLTPTLSRLLTDDVEVYIEALSLMYCKDLRKKLMKEDVTRVLGILKEGVGVSEHQEEGQWTQMSCYWKENPMVNVGWMSIEGLDFEAEAEQKNEHIHQNI